MNQKDSKRKVIFIQLFIACVFILGILPIKVYAASTPENPVYHELTGTTTWSYIYFGMYPQSIVPEGELDVTITGANYNTNGDAIIDGIKYRRQEDIEEYNYFVYEPIKWRVLKNDGETLLLMSDLVLDEISSYELSHYGREFVSYETSVLRSWLNGYGSVENGCKMDYSTKGQNFISMAFTEQEIAVLEARTNNELNLTDAISILTSTEFRDNTLGFGGESEKFEVTDYCAGKAGSGLTYVPTVCSNGMIKTYGAVAPVIEIDYDTALWSMTEPAHDSIITKDMTSNDIIVSLSRKNFVYDGKAKTPSISVNDGSEKLINGIDYTVSYSSNINAGTATVNVIGCGNYSGVKQVTFTITKADQSLSASNYTKTFGDMAFKINPKHPTGNGKISYESNDNSVASVDKFGKVTIKSAGTAKITIKAAETTNYKACLVSIQIKIAKATPTLELTKKTVVKTYGDKSFCVSEKHTGDGKVTYTSSNKKVAKINSAGTIKIVNPGTAVITVRLNETDNYKSIVKKMTVTIKKAKQTISTPKKKWTKKVGSKAFSLQAKTTGNGKFTYQSSNKKVVKVSKEGKITIVGSGSATITIKASNTSKYKASSTKVKIVVRK